MGNLAFGKDFNMVKTQEMHPAMNLLHSTTKLVGIFSHLSWIFLIAKKIPGLTAEYHRFEKWLDQQVLERMEVRVSVSQLIIPALTLILERT